MSLDSNQFAAKPLLVQTLEEGRPAGSHTPVWVMRQAGRYSPAFLKLRNNIPFLDFCKQPELCLKATMIPMRELEVDAAILFADILLIPEAMGLGLEYVKGEGPQFEHAIRTQADIDQLSYARFQENIRYVYDTVSLIRPELDPAKALIGFAGAPLTVGSYMVEGQSSRDHRHIKQMMWANDGRYDSLMELLTTSTIEYLQQQIDSGAQVVQLFDTWLGAVSPGDFIRYVKPWVCRIFEALKDAGVPTIYFAKGLGHLTAHLADIPCTNFSLDWNVSIDQFAAALPGYGLQGNLDPAYIYSDKSIIRQGVHQVLEDAKNVSRYVFNLGHGLSPDMELSKVQYLVEAVHELSLNNND